MDIETIILRFKKLVDSGQAERWIARTYFTIPADFAPIEATTNDEFDANLQHVFDALTPEQHRQLSEGLGKVLKKSWPPLYDRSATLLYMTKLIRAGRYSEFFPWLDKEIARLLGNSHVTSDSWITFLNTLTIMANVEKWAPDAGKNGAIYREALAALDKLPKPREKQPVRPLDPNIQKIVELLRAGNP